MRRIKAEDVTQAQRFAREAPEPLTLREELERLDHNPEDFEEGDADGAAQE